MLFPVRFQIEETPMGTGMSPSVLVHSQIWAPVNRAFFCPKCGRIWAKVDADADRWIAHHVPCDLELVDNYYIVPGSIWLSFEPEYLKSLSHEVLVREFELHVAHYERHHK